VELYLAKVGTGIEEWINVNSYQSGRNMSTFGTNEPVYIIAIIQKVSNKRKSLLTNPPNQYSYEQDWRH
jgi:microcompartment protein CcmK/EutM